ncbi:MULTISPECIES: hypothetical protein [unclassified Crossiella]|uniref:hypothetical protein n=1 Tax=unclassified Crossiella TaxID=2620835 RepID=UPI0020004DB8|nr:MULTISPECIES: hypothetical protein [unclassified Crossiella]MCK2242310.1 hypothetical protein [Crossiella sp. S99.2]MCK2254659.1 hypothetical protein [Crossiella sp. S99.1]
MSEEKTPEPAPDRYRGAGMYRHRVPVRWLKDGKTLGISVRARLGGYDYYCAIGQPVRVGLDEAEAWGLWACLGAALAASSTRPDWLRTDLEAE